MRFTKKISSSPVAAFRRAGYRFDRTTDQGEMSFVRVMGRGGYPRFHAYTTFQNSELAVNIHIDHKRHTHGDDTRHHGEYDGDGALAQEVARLNQVL